MTLDFLMILILLAVVILIGVFVYIRDEEASRRLKIFERTIEDINRQNYELKKMIKEQLEDSHIDIQGKLREKLQNEIKEKIFPLQKSLKEVEIITKSFQEKQRQEDNGKTESKQESGDTYDYEKRAIELYEKGVSEVEIAHTLGLHTTEVSFIIGAEKRDEV